MLALLSPAKSLNDAPVSDALALTQPQFMEETERLMVKTRSQSPKKLRELMGISEALATLNHERFQQWQSEHTPQNSLPAALTFNGDVYLGLDARSLDPDSLAWAQDRVLILSGLYGLLRPLDLIQPYRLEMGTSLKTRRGKNLYAFWKDRLAKRVSETAQEHADPTVLNLASKEYFTAANTKALKSPVVEVVFQDIKAGKARTLGFFAKRARGSMARWIIDNRADRADAIKDAVVDKYRYKDSESTDTRWVFQRKQPPPVK
ncbi:MAG: peroxide stress protein YaaA [Myxococcota bacterium]